MNCDGGREYGVGMGETSPASALLYLSLEISVEIGVGRGALFR